MSVIQVDERGRITNSKGSAIARDKAGDEFRMEEDDGMLVLRRQRRPARKARRGRRWEWGIPLHAGEASFGGLYGTPTSTLWRLSGGTHDLSPVRINRQRGCAISVFA
jgi:hypothetical protein